MLEKDKVAGDLRVLDIGLEKVECCPWSKWTTAWFLLPGPVASLEESSKNVDPYRRRAEPKAIPAVDYLMKGEVGVKRWVLEANRTMSTRAPTNKILEVYLLAERRESLKRYLDQSYTPFGYSDCAGTRRGH